jgi:hypothetical protein
MSNMRSPGQVGYEKYAECGANPWKMFDGRPMPTWDEMAHTEAGRETRRRWEDVTQADLRDFVRWFRKHNRKPSVLSDVEINDMIHEYVSELSR